MSAHTSPTSAPPDAPAPPQEAELQGQVIRVAVYLMLVLSAGAAFILHDRLWLAWRHGDAPLWAPLLAPALFTAFVVAYTVDRWMLVRRGRYPLSRALFQVATALVFLTLLLPQQASELRQPQHHVEVAAQAPALWLLGHAEGKVRASTCELMRGHYAEEVTERVASLAHNVPETDVRTNCELALERMRSETH